PEFADRLTDIDAGNSQFMIGSTKADHLMFDLPAFILQKLQACGIADAVWTGQCTYADEAHFFSYRRTTHRGESDYGRQTSMIMIHQPKEA
ncbi:MAG: laccase domain-containing protein, partial [Pseudomonadota bacterium]